jgi:hypothetical protein
MLAGGPWEKQGFLDIEMFFKDLEDLGVEDVVEKGKLLLEGIDTSPSNAEYIRRKEFAIRSVLPILEDVNIVCELRAVFGRFPSPNSSDEHKEQVKRFLGFEPLVLISLELRDEVGNKTVCNFQLTEKNLQQLLKTLGEASIQIEEMKQQHKLSKEAQ